MLVFEFIKPINNSKVDGTIQEGDVVIFINYRNDRVEQKTGQRLADIHKGTARQELR